MRIIDSFLVRDGRIVAPSRHVERMRASFDQFMASAFAPPGPNVLTLNYRKLVDALHEASASNGLFFPQVRIEGLDGHAVAGFDLRPIPESRLRQHATLALYPQVDERTHPTHKGPDFAWQEKVRAWAEERGASDALLPAPAVSTAGGGVEPHSSFTNNSFGDAEPGSVQYSETSFGSVVAWSQGVLVVSSCARRLPSVTESCVVDLALERGHEVIAAPLTEDVLREADAVWLLSSLHGIREARLLGADSSPRASRFASVDTPAGVAPSVTGAAPSAAEFRAALWESAEPFEVLAA